MVVKKFIDWGEWALAVACPPLLFVVMFAHMTALKNIGIGLMSLGTLMIATVDRRLRSWREWPLLLPFAAWCLYTLISLAWSTDLTKSWHSWGDEALFSMLAFYAFWLFATRFDSHLQVACVPWLACLLLALLSIYGFKFLQPNIPKPGLLHYYERVGHTSTLVVLVLPLFTMLCAQRGARWLGASGIAFSLIIGFATLNRFFWVAAVGTLFFACYPLYRRNSVKTLLSVVLIGTVALMMLGVSGRLRSGTETQYIAATQAIIGGHRFYEPTLLRGIEKTFSTDTRPKLWRFYLEQGLFHPWFGIGFGKPLAGIVYGPLMPAQLLKIEPQARTHAHNLLLNTFLQVGVVGLALQTALFVALWRRFRSYSATSPWLASAGIALLVGMLLKNMTDDFMWQSTMLAFWAHAGWLLGWAQRADRRAALSDHTMVVSALQLRTAQLAARRLRALSDLSRRP